MPQGKIECMKAKFHRDRLQRAAEPQAGSSHALTHAKPSRRLNPAEYKEPPSPRPEYEIKRRWVCTLLEPPDRGLLAPRTILLHAPINYYLHN
jgi:hypothetical protein